jgi:hypothetical protein
MGWNKDHVVAELQRLHRRNYDLSFTAQRSGALWRAAYRHFGSYRKAVEAAGLDYASLARKRGRWDRGTIIQNLRHLFRQGRNISSRGLRRSHTSLHAAAIHWFGSYRQAIEAAKLPWAKVTRRSPNYWNRAAIVAQIRERYRHGQPIHHAAMDREQPHVVVAAYRYFGHYGPAVDAAGLKYKERVRVRPPRTWDRRRVCRELRELYERGVGLWERRVRQVRPYLPRVARQLFGSYAAAAKVAGIAPAALKPPAFRLWSPQNILTRLQQLEAAAVPLYTSKLIASNPGLYRAAVRTYGSYRNALKAAGLSYPPPMLRHWTERLVLKTLRDLHRSGTDLRYNSIKKRYLPLYEAARHYFGQYTNSVRVAGIDYDAMVRAQLKRRAMMQV